MPVLGHVVMGDLREIIELLEWQDPWAYFTMIRTIT